MALLQSVAKLSQILDWFGSITIKRMYGQHMYGIPKHSLLILFPNDYKFDLGANQNQYPRTMDDLGFDNRI
jgi:hypothetical protein